MHGPGCAPVLGDGNCSSPCCWCMRDDGHHTPPLSSCKAWLGAAAPSESAGDGHCGASASVWRKVTIGVGSGVSLCAGCRCMGTTMPGDDDTCIEDATGCREGVESGGGDDRVGKPNQSSWNRMILT